MADYRSLVERLVASPSGRDAEARASAYDRARAALENQFGGDPERDVLLEAERRALANAISHVEAEFAAEKLLPADPFGHHPASRDDPTVAASQPASAPDGLQDREGARAQAASGVPRLRRSSGSDERLLSAWVLCTLLVVGCAVGSMLSHLHIHATVGAEGDVEGAGDTSGAAVPAPVGGSSSEVAPGSPSLVAQRAALLVELPLKPQRLKAYTGNVVWRLVHPEPAFDRTSPVRVEADVDIPEAGLRAEITFDKNLAARLPASHTIQVRFVRQPDNPVGEIDRIGIPEMRDTEDPTGDTLAGSQTKVIDDVFLIGLSNADHVIGNLHLIRSRGWIDLPILFRGHREAKLTFEKGAMGDAVWAQALAAWR